MSLRTTPLSVSALGPLEPSPGYGPAVSSGISSAAVVALGVEDPESPHAARNAAAAPPVSTVSARQRLISCGRS